ncbi:hypothetical protein [Prosthecomicrobium pneumaticum]|uniref:DUF4229 domain-containing protein n=1 Tax=Prosthecomicrobium pneumaticum TaxID=81895 RepID=A0A7W9L405_9HYPH|nr:hypothetical protein [Prosthecomicrobium pneumaticum]MBB5755092.1 hypothetical protein [Prosthecomicrobium pneumaticum]
MSFSQAWDAGFRALLIYVGVVFVWLGLVEQRFDDPETSVAAMNAAAALAAIAFFIRAFLRARAERAKAEAEVRALMEGEI